MHRVLPALLLLGCYGARELADGPRDSGTVIDTAPHPSSCERAPVEWPETSAVFAVPVRSAARDGDELYIVSSSSPGVLVIYRADGSGPAPALDRVVSFEASGGASLTIDGDRIARVIHDGSRGYHVEVRSLGSGDVLVEVPYEAIWGMSQSMVLEAERAVVVHRAAHAGQHSVLAIVDLAAGVVETVELSALSDANQFALVELDGRAHITESREGTTRLWAIGADGLSIVETQDTELQILAVRGRVISAFGPLPTSTREMYAWRPGLGLERLEPSSASSVIVGFEVMEHEGAPWIVMSDGSPTIELRDGLGFRARRAVEGATDLAVGSAFPFVSSTHRGAFVPLFGGTGDAIVWVGWSCDPTR